jgi:hypothetical protein
VLKYTQTHREIEVLADTSYCFNVYALAIINNTLLTSSNAGTANAGTANAGTANAGTAMYTPQS